MIKSIRHTGIVVRDLTKELNFYQSLGFKVFSSAKEKGGFIDKVTGLNNTSLEWVKLKASDGCLLELLEYQNPVRSERIKLQESNQLGCSHVAFGVTRIDQTCKLISTLGGSIVNPPEISDDKKAKVAYCHDPEGVLMEIVEIL